MHHFLWKGIGVLILTQSIHSLHIISPETCSIPALVPLSFQRACDRSDEYYRTDLEIASLDGNIISFTVPPRNITSSSIRRSPSIWTHEPFCLESLEAQNGYCVYTNAQFAGGRGISIITTPYQIQDVLRASIFNGFKFAEDENRAEGAKKYVHQQISGPKRFSVFANATFKRGEKIHTFTPIVALHDPVMSHMAEQDKALLLRVAVERLPMESQKLFMSQFADSTKDPYIDRVDKNAFTSQLGKASNQYMAILPENARFNHDCRPNTAYHFSAESLSNPVYGVRPIAPGEEITVSYLAPYQNFTQRQSQLLAQWGFNCTCSLCSSSASDLSISDYRLHRIQEIIGDLAKPYTERKPDPSKAEVLVKLHRQEGLFGAIAGAQVWTALEYAAMGNKKKAKKWAAEAKEGLRLWTGEEHVYHMKMLELLADGKDVSLDS